MSLARKTDIRATVRENREVAEGFYEMTLAAGDLPPRFKPGQFFQLRVRPESLAPLLRRPFAPSRITRTTLSFVYAVVGEGTRAMTKLQAKDEVALLGPLGNAYELPPAGMKAILVGGGCGAPNLAFLAEALREHGVEVYAVIGARNVTTLLELARFETLAARLIATTDDGSHGMAGHAVDGAERLLHELDEDKRIRFYGCGPLAMLRSLASLAIATGLPCQVSLEERMACGFGACMGCAVPVAAENEDDFAYARVCHDGPVFDARALAWERMDD